MTKQIKHLVFDMGGVLVDIDWHGRVSNLLGQEIPFEQIHAVWGASKSATAFEHGETDFDTFTEQFIAEHQVKLSAKQFQQEFMAILKADFPGVCELLASLQQNYTTSTLSNSNPAHWGYLVEQNTWLRFIDNPFTSMHFGVMKPEPAIYEKLIAELNCHPAEILFFDDGKKNVEAARALGINAEVTLGLDDVKTALTQYGIEF